MQIKEEKICSFTQKDTRLQLLRIIEDLIENTHFNAYGMPVAGNKVKYQVRLNRKIVSSSISEYNERKVFATYAQNIILQLKIY